jgi:peptide/nickel transport system permease protein
MRNYIIRRVLVFIPTLLLISLITFLISVHAPGDPVEQMFNTNAGDNGQVMDKLTSEKVYQEARHRFGLDLPLFYFSVTDATVPDTLYRIAKENQRNTLERLSFNFGNWPGVASYYKALCCTELALAYTPRSPENAESLNLARNEIQRLYDISDERRIEAGMDTLIHLQKRRFLLSDSLVINKLKASFISLQRNHNTWKKYLPCFHWYGRSNQYHRWLSAFVKGDFGISYQDQRPVSSSIKEAWPWTVGISLLSVLLAYLISIPLGVKAAIQKGSRSERITTATLFALYSLPGFWIGTLCVIFLCGGDWLNIFPGPGAPPIPPDAGILYTLGHLALRLVLPLICWTYGSLAFISRQMRGGILREINQDYIRTARAKGLNENTVVWKHAFRNSVLPLITLFATVFPLLVSGSVVLEHIFNIPGMGQLAYEALFSKNYPMLFAVFMITACMTLTGNLLADILYAMADPRISFSKTAKS